eukprot:7021591-Pyramimonas_sp.AAC.1
MGARTGLRKRRKRPVTRRAFLRALAGSKHLNGFFGDDDNVLDFNRSGDELQSCSAQQSENIYPGALV